MHCVPVCVCLSVSVSSCFSGIQNFPAGLSPGLLQLPAPASPRPAFPAGCRSRSSECCRHAESSVPTPSAVDTRAVLRGTPVLVFLCEAIVFLLAAFRVTFPWSLNVSGVASLCTWGSLSLRLLVHNSVRLGNVAVCPFRPLSCPPPASQRPQFHACRAADVPQLSRVLPFF